MVLYKCLESLILSGFFIFIPKLLFAHAGHRGFVMLLPTDLFIIGGGLVVVLTFFVMLIATRKTDVENFSISKVFEVSINQGFWLSFLTLIILILLVWIGFTGDRDPLKNLLSMSFWVFFWHTKNA